MGITLLLWHDCWAGEISLKTMIWDLFEICQQQHSTVAQVWNGATLKLPFRRCVNEQLYTRWLELLSIVQTKALSTNKDVPIWVLEPSGTYSVRSFYKLINLGGIPYMLQDCIWKIEVPPNIHVFMWPIIHNKGLTRDHLAKCHAVSDPTCVFCTELETIRHLLFYCTVAQYIWQVVAAEILHIPAPCSFESLSSFSKHKKKSDAINLVSSATLWGLGHL